MDKRSIEGDMTKGALNGIGMYERLLKLEPKII